MKNKVNEYLAKVRAQESVDFWWAEDYNLKAGQGVDGVRALFFKSINYKGKPTRVFCYYGAPELKNGEKAPAMVLVHGGGGVAYSSWVKMWVDRGYCAIAIDTCGRLPLDKYKGHRYEEGTIIDGKVVFDNHDYVEWARLEGEVDGYVSGPYNDGFENPTAPIDEQWLLHAICAIINGRTVLSQMPEVDNEKVGIVGISYGGIIVSEVINFDDRYAFACPCYGSSYIDKGGLGIVGGGSDQNRRQRKYNVYDLYDANQNLDKLKFPVYWSAWDKDGNFSVDSNSMSYLKTKYNGSILSIIPDYDHSHTHVWIREEIYKYADHITRGGEGLVRVLTEPEGFGDVSFKIEITNSAKDSIKATCWYMDGPLAYYDNYTLVHEWKSVEGVIDGDIVKVRVPDSAYGYYVTLTWQEKREMVVSTSYVSKNVIDF